MVLRDEVTRENGELSQGSTDCAWKLALCYGRPIIIRNRSKVNSTPDQTTEASRHQGTTKITSG